MLYYVDVEKWVIKIKWVLKKYLTVRHQCPEVCLTSLASVLTEIAEVF